MNVSRETFTTKIRRKTLEFAIFKEKCIDIFAKNASLPSPDGRQIELLFKLTERMLEVNKSMNLTAITDEESIILKHYADSLTVSVYIPQGAKVIDIGCGAGFPTLPLAIFRPDLAITALDGTAKRIEYVKQTAKMLGLDNVDAIAGRAEEYASKAEFREKFDVATARAVAALPVLAELCLPFVKKNGAFVSMKASQGERELEEAKNAIRICGGADATCDKLLLTADGENFETRVIIRTQKIALTPAKYPRHYSQISKKPL